MRLQVQNKRSVFHHSGCMLLFSRYVWKSTDWGDCQVAPLLSQQDRRLNNVSVLCGGGIQTRQLYCVQVPDNSTPHHRKEGKVQFLSDSEFSGMAIQKYIFLCIFSAARVDFIIGYIHYCSKVWGQKLTLLYSMDAYSIIVQYKSFYLSKKS